MTCFIFAVSCHPMTHPGLISHKHCKPHQTHADVDASSVLIRKSLQLYGRCVISKLNPGSILHIRINLTVSEQTSTYGWRICNSSWENHHYKSHSFRELPRVIRMIIVNRVNWEHQCIMLPTLLYHLLNISQQAAEKVALWSVKRGCQQQLHLLSVILFVCFFF